MPLIVSRVFVDNLDEYDLELRINEKLTVHQVLKQIWTKTEDFIERNVSSSDVDQLNKYLLPTKFFEVDHGYIEDDSQFDWLHKRLNLNENQSIVEMLVEMKR